MRMTAKDIPIESVRLAKARCRPRTRYHAPIPDTRNEPVRYAAVSMCGQRTHQDGLKTTSSQLVTTNFPSCITTPEGVCIQELAERIQADENTVPSATRQVATK